MNLITQADKDDVALLLNDADELAAKANTESELRKKEVRNCIIIT